MGMQLGEVARLKVSLHPVQVPICDSFGFHKHEIKAQLFVQCKWLTKQTQGYTNTVADHLSY